MRVDVAFRSKCQHDKPSLDDIEVIFSHKKHSIKRKFAAQKLRIVFIC